MSVIINSKFISNGSFIIGNVITNSYKKRAITIDHTKVGGSHSDFTFYFFWNLFLFSYCCISVSNKWVFRCRNIWELAKIFRCKGGRIKNIE